MELMQDRPYADGHTARKLRPIARTAIDAYAKLHPLPFPGSLRSSVPRLTVFPWADGEHRATLYGATMFWPLHVHYVGPLGHLVQPVGRVVEIFAYVLDEPTDVVEGWYGKCLALAAQRPHLSGRQIERLWTIAEREKVSDLAVLTENRRRFGKEIAQLTRQEYDQLVRWVQHEGHRLRMATDPRYAAKVEENVRALMERF